MPVETTIHFFNLFLAFLVLRSFFTLSGPLVFYKFGPLDSVSGPSSKYSYILAFCLYQKSISLCAELWFFVITQAQNMNFCCNFLEVPVLPVKPSSFLLFLWAIFLWRSIVLTLLLLPFLSTLQSSKSGLRSNRTNAKLTNYFQSKNKGKYI